MQYKNIGYCRVKSLSNNSKLNKITKVKIAILLLFIFKIGQQG